MTPRKPAGPQATLLNALRLNDRAIRDATITRDNLIIRAARSKVPQTKIAEAAGLSQAHVSRILAAHRKATEARKASARSGRKRETRTV